MSNMIRFLVDHTVDAVDGEKYTAGELVTLASPHSVEHFVRRGLAEVVDDNPPPPKPKKQPKMKPDLAAEAKAGDIES